MISSDELNTSHFDGFGKRTSLDLTPSGGQKDKHEIPQKRRKR
jgi:hypothetical protein